MSTFTPLYHDSCIDELETEEKYRVDLRVQQRTARTHITIVEGLPSDLDLKRILKAMKKGLSCNGVVKKDKDDNEVIQLSGDHRSAVRSFLHDAHIVDKSSVFIHG
jgi:translation initiation factor SUI1